MDANSSHCDVSLRDPMHSDYEGLLSLREGGISDEIGEHSGTTSWMGPGVPSTKTELLKNTNEE